MRVTVYADASSFLVRAQAYLEQQEVINGLPLGLALRLRQNPPDTPPLLATVEDAQGLTLAAVMTPPHRLIITSHLDEPAEAVEAFIQHLRQTDWTIPGVLGPANVSDTFVRLWDKPFRPGMNQRVYELRRVIQPADPPGSFRAPAAADLDLVAQWVLEFTLEIGQEATLEESRELAANRIAQGMIYLWEREQPVSMAAQARPTRHGTAVSLVYTPPAHRHQGYATACVARLSQRLLDAGFEFCTLFTDLANPTSNRIYQQIGYVPVCDFNEYNFLVFSEPG